MKKILLIMTGGTIGSFCEDGIIAVSDTSKYIILDKYKEFKKDGGLADFDSGSGGYENNIWNAEFDVISPFTILSENLEVEDLNKLLACLGEINMKDYLGVIITHGTDTLTYTSALLSAVYEGELDIPLIITGALSYPDEPESDAVYNFAAAVGMIGEFHKGLQRGVESDILNNIKGPLAVCSGNEVGAVVYRACELREIDVISPEFSAYGDEELGFFYFNSADVTFLDGENAFSWYDKMYKTAENGYFEPNPGHIDHCKSDLPFIIKKEHIKNIKISDGVIFIRQYPGLSYERIDLDGVRAVLVYAYHSSTLPEKFKTFAKACANAGIRLYVAPFPKNDGPVYESVKAWEGLDIIKLRDMSQEAAYAYVLVKEALLADENKSYIG